MHDSATARVDEGKFLSNGTYLPTDVAQVADTDAWPAPAPSKSGATTLATFNHHDPNGTWSLYVVDDDDATYPEAGTGEIAGWCLSVTAESPTVTTLTSSPNPSSTGADATFTARVTSGGDPILRGTVTFSEGGMTLADDVPLDANGRATFSTRALAEGIHVITATYNGTSQLATSSASVDHLAITPTTSPAAGKWCNTGSITVNPWDMATPYPSRITVSGALEMTTQVTVDVLDVGHGNPNDMDLMLVSPTGENLVVMSDSGGFEPVTGVDLTLSDRAGGEIPRLERLTSGTYRPTDTDRGGDLWQHPAPSPTGATALATFNGHDPNGEWRLFVIDDTDGNAGTIAGGWCLTIDAADRGTTATSVTSSPNPALPGDDVTFSAAVTSAGIPVTEGTVTFTRGVDTIVGSMPVNAQGRATVTTNTLPTGSYQVTATYHGTGTFIASTAVLTQTIDPAATLAGRWCNTEAIVIPASGGGPAGLYPAPITVTGTGDTTTEITVELRGIDHPWPTDLDVLLVSPTGTNLVVMSDVGGRAGTPPTGANVTFADHAGSGITFVDRGTYRPTDLDESWELPDTWPQAPTPSDATTLAAFNGADPNGTWNLYVLDDNDTTTGTIRYGWCLNVAATQSTVTTVASTPTPSPLGQPVTLTATVAGGGEPVTAGTVAFSDGNDTIADVPVDGEGHAAIDTSTLAAGAHEITATYTPVDGYTGSTATVTHVVDAVGPRAQPTVSPAPNAAGWHDGEVTVTWNWSRRGDRDRRRPLHPAEHHQPSRPGDPHRHVPRPRRQRDHCDPDGPHRHQRSDRRHHDADRPAVRLRLRRVCRLHLRRPDLRRRRLYRPRRRWQPPRHVHPWQPRVHGHRPRRRRQRDHLERHLHRRLADLRRVERRRSSAPAPATFSPALPDPTSSPPAPATTRSTASVGATRSAAAPAPTASPAAPATTLAGAAGAPTAEAAVSASSPSLEPAGSSRRRIWA